MKNIEHDYEELFDPIKTAYETIHFGNNLGYNETSEE